MTTMEEERAGKRLFVEGELAAMLSEATGGWVARLDYDARGQYEVVHVTTVPALFLTDTFGVDVTADSKWAIAKDVMRAVAARFE